MMDQIVSLGKQGFLVAVIGGIAAYILAMVIGPIQGMAFGGIIALLIAAVIALFLAGSTEVEKLDIFSLVVLLAFVGVVGGLLVGIVPAASPFIFTASSAFTVQGLIWAFVYIGIAMLVEKQFL